MSKQPLTFPCPNCGQRMGVGLALAGRRVRCPFCREVVAAPTAQPAAEPTPQLRPRSDNAPEGVESIFADPEESEDSIVGGTPTHRKPIPPSDTEVVPVTTPRPRTAVPFIAKPPSSQRHPTAPPAADSPPAAESGNPFAGLDREPLQRAKNERGPEPAEPSWANAVEAPPTDEGNPFANLASDTEAPLPRSDKSKRRPPSGTSDTVARPKADPPQARPSSGEARRSQLGAAAAVPVWVWCVLVALAGYGMLMTALAAWGWLR